ncbi:MAG: DNA polymerase III subunit delta [Eubacteriales bacterium]|nr:DNA polymerase III subunit delta [Eubacteriales bacterium]
MNWKELYEAWDAGTIASVYLFHGEEEYIKKSALERLRAKLLPAGLEALNETILEGAVGAERIIEAAETLPMMCEKRLVVVRDWGPLSSGKAKGEAEEAERLTKWLPHAPESCTLVFYCRGKADGTKKSTKALKAHEALFAPLDDATLARWLRQRAAEYGAKLSAQAGEALVFAAGRDLTRLAGEIGKLASYAGKGGEISASDVRALVSPTPESTVFEMIDALTAGRFSQAQNLLKTLLVMGENRVRILYMITRQVRLLCLTRELLSAKKTQAEVQSALGTTGYGAKRLMEQARRMRIEPLEQAYAQCVEAEYGVKSGRWRDEAALDRIMLLLRAGLK